MLEAILFILSPNSFLMLSLVLVRPDHQKGHRSMKIHQRNIDSLDSEERTIQPEKLVMNQPKYLDPDPGTHEREWSRYLAQERLAYVQSYLEEADAVSMTTETSDSGIPGTHGAPSELGIEETHGKENIFLPTKISILRIF